MSDKVVKTETIGYFERLRNSILGIFLGILLFLSSFGVLYWNEGRVDLSKVAKTSIEIPATGAANVDTGAFVSVTGTVTSPETLGDPPYLQPGDHIALKRIAEMYAWDESSSTETKKNVGGSETRTTTYTYRKVWTSSPDSSSSFEEPRGHENPPKSIENSEFKVSQAAIGDYQLDLNQLSFPVSSDVGLSSSNVAPQYQAQQTGNYIFVGRGSVNSPEIGDMRLSYQALNKGVQGTVFASFSGQNQLAPHLAKKNVSVYRLVLGNREQAIATLATQHKIMTWGLRLAGFLMMWFGLNLMIEPLGVLLDFFPFLGDLARTATGFVTFLVAAALSSLTIVVSIILHNPIMLFLAAGLSGFFVYRWFKGRKPKVTPVDA